MPKAVATHKTRKWVFTINNFETTNINFPDRIQYAVWQQERASTGQLHLQGCFVVDRKSSAMSLSAARKLLLEACANSRPAHLEPMRGTVEEAADYCSKAETRVSGPFVFGSKPPGAGARTDLEEVKALLDLPNGLELVKDSHFGLWCRYERAFRTYVAESFKHSYDAPQVTVVYGPTNTGKTHYCQLATASSKTYWKYIGKWWDRYEQQQHVVIDEFYGWLQYSVLLRILDKYPFSVETKGSSAPWNGKHIFITSNARPDDWYQYNERNMLFSALKRRVTKWVYIPRRASVEEYDDYDSFSDAIGPPPSLVW